MRALALVAVCASSVLACADAAFAAPYHDRPEELARTLRPFLRPHGSPPRR